MGWRYSGDRCLPVAERTLVESRWLEIVTVG